MRSFLLAVLALLWTALLDAHPGRGIVIDAQGRIFVADAVRSVVWRVSPDGRVSAAAREVHAHWLALHEDGVLADQVRHVDGRFPRGLLHLDAQGTVRELIEPAPDPHGLDAGAFAATPRGIAIARDSQRTIDWWVDGARSRGALLELGDDDTINSLIATPEGALIAVLGRALWSLPVDQPPRLIATVPAGSAQRLLQLRELWGLARAADGTLYTTDPGLRTVLRIGTDGRFSTVFESETPWFPTGVAHDRGQLYILEHGLDERGNLGPRIRRVDPAGGTTILAIIED